MSSTAARVQNLLAHNATYAQTYKKPIPLTAIRQNVKAMNGRSVIILSCSDPRVVPADFMGVKTGGTSNFLPIAICKLLAHEADREIEFGIIRNAGGRAAEAIKSLVVLDALVPIGTVMVVHHTDCGQTHVSDDEVRRVVKGRNPDMGGLVEGMEFGEITDMDGSVRDDMALLKAEKLLPVDMEVLGYVLDLETGLLREVKQ